MSKTIDIQLSDAQALALATEAEAAGRKFFDHCRAKLMTGIGLPAGSGKAGRLVSEAQVPDRIDRLEAMMLEMGRAIQNLAHPVAASEAGPPDGEIDIDDVVSHGLSEAEQAGLTAVDREPVQMQGGVRHVGSRKPAPFSPQTQPRHLSGLSAG